MPDRDLSSTSDSADIRALARQFIAASETGQTLVPPSTRFPAFSLENAYAVEAEIKQLREADGHRAVGLKVGYANKAVWRALKLGTLVWAHMYDDTVHRANGGSARLKLAHPRSMKIEPEIVFGLKQELAPPELDAASALARVAWLAIGFELIDCPFPE